MTTAKLVKRLDGFQGDARLYKLSEPIAFGWDEERQETAYVVISARRVLGGPETYIFPSDSSGRILNWTELHGSFKGGLDHDEAARNAGWEAT